MAAMTDLAFEFPWMSQIGILTPNWSIMGVTSYSMEYFTEEEVLMAIPLQLIEKS